MPPTPTTGETAARRVDDQFLDLICTDADLLRAEFEAIIAAEWPSPPANPPGHRTTGQHPTSRAARWLTARLGGAVSRPRQPGIGGWARQRSPPPRQPPTNDRKAGDRTTSEPNFTR
jgi:hypothetical protein